MALENSHSLNVGEIERTPKRICFRVRVDEIPGVPEARALTLANHFMEERFSRKFSWNQDYIYTPASIDGSGKAWILLDINASPTTVNSQVPLEAFRVTITGDIWYAQKPYQESRY